MLFSKVKYFKINKDFPLDEASLSKSLVSNLFVKIQSAQLSTQGFVDPYSQYTEKPVYSVSDAFMVCLRVDSKSIPPAAVKRKTQLRVRDFEKKKGEDASKEEKVELKEAVLTEMISAFPVDFVKTKYINAVLFPKDGILAIDSVSKNDCELMATMLRASIGTLPIIDFESDSIPATVMTDWLRDEENIPEELTLLQECQLKDDVDDNGAAAHCKKQDLTSDEIEAHLDAGKVVSMIAVEWNDSLKFKIKEDLTVVGISYTDFLKERLKDDVGDGKGVQKFDAEVALTVENLRMLAPSLLVIFS